MNSWIVTSVQSPSVASLRTLCKTSLTTVVLLHKEEGGDRARGLIPDQELLVLHSARTSALHLWRRDGWAIAEV